MKYLKILILTVVVIFSMKIVLSGSCGAEIKCKCGDIINKNYILKENLKCNKEDESIKINQNQILDCRGFEIIGKGEGIGIIVEGVKNSQIKNCKIKNFTKGIEITYREVKTGTGWGTNWQYKVPSENLIIKNNFFENLQTGIEIKSGKNNYIINNSFINIKDGLVIKSNPSKVFQNKFENSSIEYSSTKSHSFCINNKSNIYTQNSIGPSCKCHIPKSSIKINSKINFCEGNYKINEGIHLEENGEINCLNTHLIGNNNSNGISIIGSRKTTINGCTISNYSIGIKYDQKYSKSTGYVFSYQNKIINSTIFNVETGIKMIKGYASRSNYAETVVGNSIIGEKYSIMNHVSSILKVKNNYWGSNNLSIVNNTFLNPNKVKFIPYLKKNTQIDYYIDNQSIKYNFSTKILSFSILKNQIINPNQKLKLTFTIFRNNSHLFNLSKIILDSKHSWKMSENINLTLKENDRVQISIETNITKSNYDNNFFEYFIIKNKKYSFVVETGFSKADEEILNFLRKTLDKSKINNSIFIQIKKKNNIFFNYPYGFKLESKHNSKNTTIHIIGNDLSGILSGIKKYINNKELIESQNILLKNNKEDIFSLKIYDYLENKIKILENNEAIVYIVKNILNDKLHTLEILKMKIPNKNESYQSFKLKPEFSKKMNKFLSNNKTTIVMGGGLWSDINTWNELGKKLVDKGHTIFLIELTGGEKIECETCHNYNYSFLIKNVFPKYINMILNETNKSNIIYIGHSNGARVAIDSINNNLLNKNIFENLITVGIPGAFDGESLIKKFIIKYGNKSIESNKNKKHVSITDLTLPKLFNFNSQTKISLNLWKNYYNWISSEKDKQPGGDLELEKFILIGGTRMNNKHDGIVTKIDEEEIYSNIDAKYKKKYFGDYIHVGMSNNKEIQNLIMYEINKKDD